MTIGTLLVRGFVQLVKLFKWIGFALRFLPGEIVLSKFPLRLGEECQVSYRRRLRCGQMPLSMTLNAQLVCYEWVSYAKGTVTETLTQKVWEQSLPAKNLLLDSKLEYDCTIQIPSQGFPSFEAEHNKICWALQVSLEQSERSKSTSTFFLTVEPEVLG